MRFSTHDIRVMGKFSAIRDDGFRAPAAGVATDAHGGHDGSPAYGITDAGFVRAVTGGEGVI